MARTASSYSTGRSATYHSTARPSCRLKSRPIDASRGVAAASAEDGELAVGEVAILSAEDGELAVGEVAGTWRSRSDDIFPLPRIDRPAGDPGKRVHAVDERQGAAVPEKRGAKCPCKTDVVRDVATIKQLRRRKDAAQAPRRRKDEGMRGICRLHDEAEAAERSVVVDEPAVMPARAVGRRERSHARPLLPPREDRHRDQRARGERPETLRLDDRLGVRRRRDVGVGDALVPQRRAEQQRRMPGEGALDIPTREIASHEGSARRVGHLRMDRQKCSDHASVALQQAPVARIAGRARAAAQSFDPALPPSGGMRREALGKQVDDGVDIRLFDNAAAQDG